MENLARPPDGRARLLIRQECVPELAVGVAPIVGVAPVVGVVVGQLVPVPLLTMELVIGVNSTICACSRLCVRNPAISARSPRARLVVAMPVDAVVHGFIVHLVGCHVGMPFHGREDVCETVAVFWVTATCTVTVCAAMLGASIEPTVIGPPAITVLAGIRLPVVMAVLVALMLPVIAPVPELVFDTFWNAVFPEVSHRCRPPLADCRMMNLFVASTTAPRCSTNVLLCWVACMYVD